MNEEEREELFKIIDRLLVYISIQNTVLFLTFGNLSGLNSWHLEAVKSFEENGSLDSIVKLLNEKYGRNITLTDAKEAMNKFTNKGN